MERTLNAAVDDRPARQVGSPVWAARAQSVCDAVRIPEQRDGHPRSVRPIGPAVSSQLQPAQCQVSIFIVVSSIAEPRLRIACRWGRVAWG